MKRRLICLALTVLLIVSLVPTMAFAAENPFTDVPETANGKPYPFYDSILWAVENGITSGYDDGTFRPNATCTRGHVVTFLWRAAGEPAPKSMKNPFNDVEESSPFYKAILWASENGITSGYDDGTFRPGAACTRAHVVTFLWRYDNKPAASGEVNITDLAGLNADFTAAIKWAASNGVVAGYDDGSFRPHNVCTRAHVVTFIYRDMNRGPQKIVYLMSEKITESSTGTTVWTYSHDEYGNIVSGVLKDKSGAQIGTMTSTYFDAAKGIHKETVRVISGETETTVYDQTTGEIKTQTITAADGSVTSRLGNTYNAQGLLVKTVAEDKSAGSVATEEYSYNAQGQITKDVLTTVYADGASDEIVTEYSYSDGKMSGQTITGTDSEGGKYSATVKCIYDANGREKQRKTDFSIPGAASYSLDFTFTYDSAGNLTKQVQKMSGAGIIVPITVFTYSYSYQKFGNTYYKTKESVVSPMANDESYTVEYTYEYR